MYMSSLLFFDIEISKLDSLDPKDYDMLREENPSFDFQPEFNKIICISYADSSDWEVHSLVGEETKIISEFMRVVQKSDKICWYNILWFDAPFIAKRSVILWLPIVNKLKAHNVKPWDCNHILDLFLVWKHWSTKACNLDTLCGALDIPTPKDKMDWSEVDTYYRAGRIDEIKEYCEKDVIACVKVWKRFVETNLI